MIDFAEVLTTLPTWAIAFAFGYLVGAIPFGLIITRLAGTQMKAFTHHRGVLDDNAADARVRRCRVQTTFRKRERTCHVRVIGGAIVGSPAGATLFPVAAAKASGQAVPLVLGLEREGGLISRFETVICHNNLVSDFGQQQLQMAAGWRVSFT